MVNLSCTILSEINQAQSYRMCNFFYMRFGKCITICRESKCTCQEVKVRGCLTRKGQSKGNPCGNETILYPDEVGGYTTRHMEEMSAHPSSLQHYSQ